MYADGATVYAATRDGGLSIISFTVTPDAPTNLAATAGTGSLEIAFDAPASAGDTAITKYEYSADAGGNWTAFDPAVTAGPVTITGLTEYTEYTKYTVPLRAINSVGSGAASDNMTGTPLHGPLLVHATSLDPTDANCTEGGVQMDVGYDDDLSEALEAGEITSTQYACNGSDGTNGTNGFMMWVVTSDATTTDCTNGGVQIEVGFDDGLAADGTTTAGSADDGSLDEGEIDTTEIVCNGVEGTNGENGVSALVIRTEATKDDCPNGGETIQVGLDDDGNGELDSVEIDQTVHVCNGLDGVDGANGAQGQTGTDGADALVAVTEEPVGDNCVHGGDKVETGLDDNDNGTLDEAEVDHTMYLCDGVPGADGMHGADGTEGESGNRALTDIVTLAVGSEECATGGVVVRSGIDTDRDRILDADELDETLVICNGTDGIVDEDKNGTDDRLELAAPASCAASSNAVPLWGLLALTGMLARRRRR